MLNHTKEPWFINERAFIDYETEIETDSHVIAQVKHYSTDKHKFTRGKKVDVYLTEGHSNAARIVQCVNALAGIEDVEAFVNEAKRLMEAQNG